jgi:CheY-like chemotaxis protein
MNVSRTSILLADDDADDRSFFREFLEDRDDISLLEEVENGEVLLETLKGSADEKLPSLIILDQNMPKLNGLQTLELLKSNSRFSRIPVMVYSTYINGHLMDKCKQAGALLVATKPVNKKGYEQMIDDFLQALP